MGCASSVIIRQRQRVITSITKIRVQVKNEAYTYEALQLFTDNGAHENAILKYNIFNAI